MKILHITNDYSGSTVYKNLVGELDNLGIPQVIYTPVKSKTSIGKNKIDLKVSSSEIIYSHILNKTTDRIFYKKKIKKILKDIETKIDFSEIKMIHAHTWYSDGGVAYLLSQKYNIPYIVAIRNTDLNLFFKYFLHERSFGKKILESAKNIITISEVYKNRVLTQQSLSDSISKIKTKMLVIPNGVDPFWLDNIRKNFKLNKTVENFLYIGNFNRSKNVLNLVKAIISLNKRGIKCSLNIVGGGGVNEAQIMNYINMYPEYFEFYGKVYEKTKLLEIIRKSDVFTMPSRNETFGLVYVEAMLQGLPILYTESEGIDGLYSDKIGEKVSKNANDIEIADSLIKMIEGYKDYNVPIEELIKNHDWGLIAKEYKKIYSL